MLPIDGRSSCRQWLWPPALILLLHFAVVPVAAPGAPACGRRHSFIYSNNNSKIQSTLGCGLVSAEFTYFCSVFLEIGSGRPRDPLLFVFVCF